MIESYLAIPPIIGILGLLVALGIYLVVTNFPEGEEKVKKIGDQIHLGAMTFMKTEYTYLSIFAFVVIIVFFLRSGHRASCISWSLIIIYSWVDWYVFCY